jgi:hypothetical protein
MINLVFTLLRKVNRSYLMKDNSNEDLAGRALFEFVSFRLTENSSSFIIVCLRQFKDVCKRLYSKPVYLHFNNHSGVAILDADLKDEPIRSKYIRQLIDKDIELVFTKDSLLMDFGIWDTIKLSLIAFYLFVKVIFLRKPYQRKSNYALLIRQIPEIICLIRFIKKHQIKIFFDFENYQVDSNFLYLVLQKLNVIVYKVPSSGPLYMHNSIVLADCLVLSSGYQLEEVKDLKATLRFQYLLKAMPELAGTYVEDYINFESNTIKAFTEPDLYSIGYYSHGSWLRSSDKDADNNLNLHEAESNTLNILNLFIERNPQFKLIIFTHPRERSSTILEKTKAFYKSKFPNIRFELASFELKSTQTFRKVNIAVIALSTILFERLYIGTKTLICKSGINGFPKPDSQLQTISFNTIDELEVLIQNGLNVSIEDFYKKNKLESYLFKNFNNQLEYVS